MLRRSASAFALTCFTLLGAAQTKTANPKKVEIEIKSGQGWVDTGVDLQAGDSVTISATGTMNYGSGSPAGPEGLARGWKDLLRVLPLNDANRGALIGRIGDPKDNAAIRPFLVGPGREVISVRAGRVFLGLNQMSNDVADGSFKVTLAVTTGAKKMVDPKTVQVPLISQSVLDGLPRRVQDAQGGMGDTVNFLVVGSQEKLLAALDASGWVKVDRTTKDAILGGILRSVSKQAYTQLPMSELYLFGRPQDYGMAHAEPFSVVATRHHFRIWKAPQTIDGQTLWVGAGTHDIGFDRDQRNNGITHKIDPDIDKERDFIRDSFIESGLTLKTDYMTPSEPVKKAKTAHGEEYNSDGRTLIVWLEGGSSVDTTITSAFANTFCTVLSQENPDGGTWGDCGQYINLPSKNPQNVALTDLPTGYRLLVVPGILNSCASAAPAFEEARVHLKEKHNFEMELLSVPNDSSEQNAALIAKYINEKSAGDARKYIVVGYSKGTPDLQTTLATYPDVAKKVAAFISVAGASGGSPIADILPAQMDAWIKKFKFGKCEGDLSVGFKSLRREVRTAFLARYPKPVVPTYSIAAVSDASNTSKLLASNLKLMAVFGDQNDSQLTRPDASIPGSTYLGEARGDHFAVALPLEKMEDGALKALVDKGNYPRAALLESLLRFIAKDLGPGATAPTTTTAPSKFSLGDPE